MKSKDTIAEYLSSLDAMKSEKAELEARLAQINAALNGEAPTPAPVRRRMAPKLNQMSLKAAVLQVTRKKPLTKQQILEAVQGIGYKFSTNDPMNSLNAMLYSSGVFSNKDGRFSPK